MDESQIVDIWTLFKEYIDKKNVEVAAERFVDMLADYGVDDHTPVSYTHLTLPTTPYV